ncbi:hypothetical protein [Pseudomonas sp. PLMAX]|uniref:hypothetical protein n=1 Tax=Pseudomonas sp. PLMAX TaxID=2201998 RepID=UPI0038B706E1
MFISHESCLLRLPGFSGAGLAAWRMVERNSIDPWYHVLVRDHEGARAYTRKKMPTDLSLLAGLLAKQSPTFVIEEVQVVTPPSMNGGISERMEVLINLVVGYDQNGEYVMLHKVESGTVYSSAPDSAIDAGSLTSPRTIYKAKQQAASPPQK